MNGYLLLVLELAGILVACTVLAFVIGRRSGRGRVQTEPSSSAAESGTLSGRTGVSAGDLPVGGGAVTGTGHLVDKDFSFAPETTADQPFAQVQAVSVSSGTPAEPDHPENTPGISEPEASADETILADLSISTTVLAASAVASENTRDAAAESTSEAEVKNTAEEPEAAQEALPDEDFSIADRPEPTSDKAKSEHDDEKVSQGDYQTVERIKELEQKVRQQEIEMARLEAGATTAWDTTMPKMLNRIDELEAELGKALRESQELHNLLEIEREKVERDGWPIEPSE